MKDTSFRINAQVKCWEKRKSPKRHNPLSAWFRFCAIEERMKSSAKDRPTFPDSATPGTNVSTLKHRDYHLPVRVSVSKAINLFNILDSRRCSMGVLSASWITILFCFLYVHIWVECGMCMCMCLDMHVEVQGWHPVSSWIAFYNSHWGRVYCWPWNSSFQQVWLACLLYGFPVCLLRGGTTAGPPSPAIFYMASGFISSELSPRSLSCSSKRSWLTVEQVQTT